jgi:hypothetical protein
MLLLFVPFKIVSPYIDTPLPAFLKVAEAAPEGTFWKATQLLCHGIIVQEISLPRCPQLRAITMNAWV